jgi:transcriptional regulator with XRE-family HTH domain
MLVSDLHERIRQHVLATIKSGVITGTALAERIGVQQAHISNFLAGRRGLSIEAMDAILDALGLNVEQLVAGADQAANPKGSTAGIESVPIIHPRTAMNPTFADDDVVGTTGFTKALLRRLKALSPDTRTLWVRFVAISADAELAAPMLPVFSKGSVLLVDRHYCSLDAYRKHEPNLYLIRNGEKCMVRRAEMLGSQLCLRPERNDYPLDFVSIDRKNPLESCIVGRVAHVATET